MHLHTCLQGDASSKTVVLKEGSTAYVELLVTAEDGRTTKLYNISITRLSADDACLSQLELSSGVLKPSFSPTVHDYYCYLPGSLSSISLRTQTEDEAMKVTMKDGSAVGTAQLSAGHTLIEVVVTSVNKKNTSVYSVCATRLRCPYELVVEQSICCGVCGGTVHCPCHVKGSEALYCWRCLEEVTRISKTDPLSGKLLREGWLVLDYEADKRFSSLPATSSTPYGELEGSLTELPVTMTQQRKSWKESMDEVSNQYCTLYTAMIIYSLTSDLS